jgi:2'-5' RNA ligase
MPEFAVVALLRPAPAEVHTSDWPLHLTLALFDADADADADRVASVITGVAARHAPFLIEPGPSADFGEDGDVPVVLVVPDEPPRRVHQLLVDKVCLSGWRMRDPYWGPRFAPHVSNTARESFHEAHRVESLSLYERTGQNWTLRASCPLASETPG